MLLFLNFDCVLAPPADDAGPGSGGASGVRRLEGLLRDWPHVRIVVTSGRRYRLTLAHFRSFVAAEFRHRLIATTLLYGRGTQAVRRRTREDEVLDWLEAARCEHADWLALDSGRHDYVEHADRLLLCTTLTHSAVARLHCELLRRFGEPEAVENRPSAATWGPASVGRRFAAPLSKSYSPFAPQPRRGD